MRMQYMWRSTVLVLAVVAVCIPSITVAQSILPGIFGDSTLELSVNPQTSGPNEDVTITARSFSLDLARSQVSWYVNGALVDSGAGLDAYTFRTGALGTAHRIRVVAEQAGKAPGSAELTLRPVSLSIAWEANSYTPPFYRGRALPSVGTTVRAHAFVDFIRTDGSRVPEENIIYTWQVNGSTVTNASGRGHSSATLAGPGLFGESVITVSAETTDYVFSGSTSIAVPATEPLLVLYPNSSLGGVLYHRALSRQARIIDSEVTVAAVPYYAPSLSEDDQTLRYTWNVNGSPVAADTTDPNQITLSIGAAAAGEATIELDVSSTRHFLSTAHRSWTLTLEEGSAPSGDPFRRAFE